MNNYVSLFLAILENAKVITADQAKKLADEFQSSTLPGTYAEASRLVGDLFAKHEVSTIQTHIEAGVEDVKAYVDSELEKLKGDTKTQKKAVDTK